MNFFYCNSQPTAQKETWGDKSASPGPGLQLGIATIPMQPWETPYTPARALKQGTMFPCLDLPFFVTGGELNG